MYERGSEWRKWDLHVHTPSSIVNNYGSDSDATWEQFIADLEVLPPEFKVLGINDYLFVDGYERLVLEKKKGRLKNIETLLPVIELRIDKFAGTTGALRRINLHVIFDEMIDPRIIKTQFLATLVPDYHLSPEWSDSQTVVWNGVIDRDSLQDLGSKIIESVPVAERHKFGTPLIEGFNNLTVSLEQVRKALRAEYFKNRTLTAIGKTEWASIKWQDGSIADKKTIINTAQLVFVAAENESAYQGARASLKNAGVNDRLLDCSDAHDFSTSPNKDRIGNCLTWIKADPTFAGLKHAMREFEARVFVGTRPLKLQTLLTSPGRYIDSVQVVKVSNYPLEEIWFDVDIPLNPDLTAIIGNKGSGKSALADVIGLLGRTRNSADFSFLNDRKFRLPRNNKAKYFKATLNWVAGEPNTTSLDADVPKTESETVRYLPQHYLEKLCNELVETEDSDFDRELRATIFSHLKTEDRLGKASLEELIAFRTSEVWEAIAQLRLLLSTHNAQVTDLEVQASPPHRESLERKLASVRTEITSLQSKRPAVIELPKAETPAAKAQQQHLDNMRAAWRKLNQNVVEKQKRLDHLVTQAEVATKLATKLDTLVTYIDAQRALIEQDQTTLGITGLLLRFEVSKNLLSDRHADLLRGIKATSQELMVSKGALEEQNTQGQAFRTQLEEKSRRHEQYVADIEAWQQKLTALQGDANTPGSAAYLEEQIKHLDSLSEEIERAVQARNEVTAAIFDKLKGLSETYRTLYKPVQDFIANNPVVRARFELSFSVALVETSFAEGLFDILNRQHIGSFQGTIEGERLVKDILDRADLQTIEGLNSFLNEMMDKLSFDRRTSESRPVTMESQLRRGRTKQALYDFLFGLGYIVPRYTLTLGDKSLQLLSPGERGLLLLIFYLLVDQETAPLVIDQPEENLDNQTIFELLVPCIKAAKLRRQVVIITHNPNLAVVCDAEQIIVAHMNTVDSRVTYVSGSIENPKINAEVVKILEGTMPAFENRGGKYLR